MKHRESKHTPRHTAAKIQKEGPISTQTTGIKASEENPIPVVEGELVVADFLKKTVEQEIDYDLIEITRGQYWITQGNFFAFVLEVNEYAVIIQQMMSMNAADDAVFDYQGGQELVSLQLFRKELKRKTAKLLFPDPKNVKLALDLYLQHLAENKIFQPKQLPRTKEDAEALVEYERYTLERRIVPPPKEYRTRKGYHWLTAGRAGTQFVCKLWDPKAIVTASGEVIDNWVLPNGTIDKTAGLGFVTGYHSLAFLIPGQNESQDFESLLTQVFNALDTNYYFYSRDHIRTEFKKLNIPYFQETQPDGLVVDVVDAYDIYDLCLLFSASKESKYGSLSIIFSVKQKAKFRVTFSGVQNRENIPHNPIVFAKFE